MIEFLFPLFSANHKQLIIFPFTIATPSNFVVYVKKMECNHLTHFFLSSLYLFISDSRWIIVIVFGPNYFKKMNDIYSDGIFSSLKEARRMDHED